MKLAHFFIDRPVFAAVLAIIITLVGAIAFPGLPVSQYPSIVPPTVNITATYPGASAQVLADTVATPIEEQVNGVQDMLYMSSQATGDGHLTITVTFRLGSDLNIDQVQVQNRLDAGQFAGPAVRRQLRRPAHPRPAAAPARRRRHHQPRHPRLLHAHLDRPGSRRRP